MLMKLTTGLFLPRNHFRDSGVVSILVDEIKINIAQTNKCEVASLISDILYL